MPPPDEHSEQAHLEATRRYYNEFSTRYDQQRGGRVPSGYHDLIDELEMGFLERHARGKRVLEVGCGTGLLLQRMQKFAAQAQGLDLSPQMLEHARARGLDVVQGSATKLPFEDHSFDIACSFKVLAHIQPIETALREMVRVVRPGGTVIGEFYNPSSFRSLGKRFGPARAISTRTNEDAVFTRYDSPQAVRKLIPTGCTIIDQRGVRIVTPVAGALKLPIIGRLLRAAERRLCDTALHRFGGFWLVAFRRDG